MGEELGPAAPGASSAFAAAPLDPGAESGALDRILRMADRHFSGRQLREAADVYFEVAERWSRAPEGTRARERLLKIAELYEERGQLRQARGIYERLL